MVLEEYKDMVGTVASVTTILQFFSGVFVCKGIKQKGNSGGDSVIPFLGGVVISALNLKYSLLLGDTAMVSVNIFGLILNMAYLRFFYSYSPCKDEIWNQIVQGIVFSGFLLGYAHFWEEPELVEKRFGAIVTILMLLLIASPLFSLGEVIRTKSTSTLPFPIIISGTVVTFEWLLYGIIIDNPFLQLQNGVGLALCVAQLSLFAIFPSTPPKETKKSKKLN